MSAVQLLQHNIFVQRQFPAGKLERAAAFAHERP
jgi:hypothetical protein